MCKADNRKEEGNKETKTKKETNAREEEEPAVHGREERKKGISKEIEQIMHESPLSML